MSANIVRIKETDPQLHAKVPRALKLAFKEKAARNLRPLNFEIACALNYVYKHGIEFDQLGFPLSRTNKEGIS